MREHARQQAPAAPFLRRYHTGTVRMSTWVLTRSGGSHAPSEAPLPLTLAVGAEGAVPLP
jgi:hypothetical protein